MRVYRSKEVIVTDGDRLSCDGCEYEAGDLTAAQAIRLARAHVRETGHTVLRGSYSAQAFRPTPFPPPKEASHVQ